MSNLACLSAFRSAIVDDPAHLAAVVEAIVHGGAHALQLIVDYDRTLTKARHADGAATATSYGAVLAYLSLPTTLSTRCPVAHCLKPATSALYLASHLLPRILWVQHICRLAIVSPFPYRCKCRRR